MKIPRLHVFKRY